MVNKRKLGVEAGEGGGLFALGKRTSRVKMVPGSAGAVIQLRGGGAAGWEACSCAERRRHGVGGCHDPREGAAAGHPCSGRIPVGSPSHGKLRAGQVEGTAQRPSCNRAPGAPAPPSAPSRF